MKQAIILNISDLKTVLISILADDKISKALNKPQLIFKEACELYGEHRIRKYIKSGLLKSVSQNGKRSAIYYSHKKIIELTQKSFHHLTDVEL